MPIRGKMLNLQKATIEKIQKNAEVMTIIEAIGLELNPKTMKYEIPASGLRYGKIIIESDADVSNTAYERLFA
jgi:DNA gyrase/topoisomerase IV subunit B